MNPSKTVVALLVVLLVIVAYNAYVSTRVAQALMQVNADVANAKVSLSSWRKLLGL